MSSDGIEARAWLSSQITEKLSTLLPHEALGIVVRSTIELVKYFRPTATRQWFLEAMSDAWDYWDKP